MIHSAETSAAQAQNLSSSTEQVSMNVQAVATAVEETGVRLAELASTLPRLTSPSQSDGHQRAAQ